MTIRKLHSNNVTANRTDIATQYDELFFDDVANSLLLPDPTGLLEMKIAPQGSGGNNLSNQTIILNSVAAGAVYTGVDVPQWSASYTGQGGQLLIKADVVAWTGSVGAKNWYLKKNGTVVATGNFYFNVANTHMTMPPIQYIDTSGSTSSATWSISLGSNLIADQNDRATITVIEYTGISSLNVSSLSSNGTVNGSYLVSTNAAGDEGGEIQLAKAPNSTLSGGITIDSYQNKLRIFEQGGSARGVSIDLSKAPAGVGSELLTKVSGFVNAGTFLSLDNLKVSVTTSGQRGLSLAAVSGSFNAMISGTFGYTSGGGGQSTNGGVTYTYTTTPSGSLFGWGFPNAGDGSTYIINDTTNTRVYRVTLMIGPGYNNNFLCIERLY